MKYGRGGKRQMYKKPPGRGKGGNFLNWGTCWGKKTSEGEENRFGGKKKRKKTPKSSRGWGEGATLEEESGKCLP